MKDLWQESPLVELADQIVKQCTSSMALKHIDAKPENQQDEAKHKTIMCNWDILQYIILDEAVKHGDIGLMEDSLLHLLFQFIGGKNSNYTTEILELLQLLHHKWPMEVK